MNCLNFVSYKKGKKSCKSLFLKILKEKREKRVLRRGSLIFNNGGSEFEKFDIAEW